MSFQSVSRRLAIAAIGFALLGGLAQAQDLPAPTEDVVLTVTGRIGVTNAPDAAVFDIAGFASLGSETIETTTIWTDGKSTYTGVPLTTFLEKLKAEGSILRVWALNDYTVDVPFADAVPNGPILAFEKDGQPLSVRDKGPIWLIYPFDADPIYQTEVIYARSIWQIDRMEVVE